MTSRPEGVRAQERTGAFFVKGKMNLFVIEQGSGVKGIQIAHLASKAADGMFEPMDPKQRYLIDQPSQLAYGGQVTPVMREGTLRALFWDVWQTKKRYGLRGHPATFGRKVTK